MRHVLDRRADGVGREVDDAAELPLGHSWHHRLAEQEGEGGGQIDVENLTPQVEIELGEAARGKEAGVGDKDIAAACASRTARACRMPRAPPVTIST